MMKNKLRHRLDHLAGIESRMYRDCSDFVEHGVNEYLTVYGEDKWIKEFKKDYKEMRKERDEECNL